LDVDIKVDIKLQDAAQANRQQGHQTEENGASEAESDQEGRVAVTEPRSLSGGINAKAEALVRTYGDDGEISCWQSRASGVA